MVQLVTDMHGKPLGNCPIPLPGFQVTSSADFDDLILDLAGNGGFIYRATSRYSWISYQSASTVWALPTWNRWKTTLFGEDLCWPKCHTCWLLQPAPKVCSSQFITKASLYTIHVVQLSKSFPPQESMLDPQASKEQPLNIEASAFSEPKLWDPSESGLLLSPFRLSQGKPRSNRFFLPRSVLTLIFPKKKNKQKPIESWRTHSTKKYTPCN